VRRREMEIPLPQLDRRPGFPVYLLAYRATSGRPATVDTWRETAGSAP